MRKYVMWIIGLAGILLLAMGIYADIGNPTVAVIGGADGPTSVFVAAKVGGSFAVGLIFTGAAAIGGFAAWIMKKRGKK